MTKVLEKTVKCAKCGDESKQLDIYNANFLLEDEKDNKELLEHKQTCPNCGYSASDISKNREA